MPGTLNPGQMFDNTEIELSGRSMSYPLDFAGPADPNDDTAVMQGGICSLSADGRIVAGLGGTTAATVQAGLTPMGLIAIQGRDEFDANSDVGNFSGGVQSVLVCSGGYEIETTEFATGTYLPNHALTFGVGADRGKVTLAGDNYSDVQVVGVVSRAVRANEYNKSVLAFWTTFCPAVAVTAVTA